MSQILGYEVKVTLSQVTATTTYFGLELSSVSIELSFLCTLTLKKCQNFTTLWRPCHLCVPGQHLDSIGGNSLSFLLDFIQGLWHLLLNWQPEEGFLKMGEIRQ